MLTTDSERNLGYKRQQQGPA